MSEIERSNIILYTPEGKAFNEFMDLIQNSPWDWQLHKDCAFIVNFQEFFFFQPHDGSKGRWRHYDETLLSEGDYVLNKFILHFTW
jgi:hypothetical protein